MVNKVERQGTAKDTGKELVLTTGEILMISRRRKKWTQSQAAKQHKVSIFIYKLAEYDRSKGFKYGNLKISALEDHEKCLIYRKRSKKTQPQIARLCGIGQYWLRLQETGKVPCHKLLEFWETR